MNSLSIAAAILAGLVAAAPAAALDLESAYSTASDAARGRPTADLPDVWPVLGGAAGAPLDPAGLGERKTAAPGPTESEGGSAAPADPVTTYGVIINGDSESHHTGNVDRFYEHMTGHYGIAAADITVISTHRGVLSDRRGVDHAARTVKRKADGNDRVVIYTTGHGSRSGNSTYLVLHGDEMISSRDFAAAFLGNSAARITYVADQCYSGGFVEAMTSSSRDVLAMSASDAYNTTYCQSFIVPYLDAFSDSGNDTNGDGSVDEREAFATASRSHRRDMGPQQGNAQIRQSVPSARRADLPIS